MKKININEILSISTIVDIEKLQKGAIPAWIEHINLSIKDKYALIDKARKI
ncbi:MAG TPA: hypothetical protein PKK56_03125 [archaeon]|nr:hypothetical protein [archaeon]